jgi:HAD superfamily hydrolase (TIGR01549 family)
MTGQISSLGLEKTLDKLSSLSAVLFDLDDTLVQTTHFNNMSLASAIKVLEDRIYPSPDQERIEQFRTKILETKIKHGIEFRPVFEKLERDLGIKDKMVLTELTWAYDRAEEVNMKLFPGASHLLKSLLQNKLKIGVVTNGDSYRQWKKLLLTGIGEFFETVIISQEVNRAKPDPEIFQMALGEIGEVEASKCAFVGDDPKNDIAGANKSNLISIRVRQGRNATKEPANTEQEPQFEFRGLKELKDSLSIAMGWKV